MLWRRRTKLLPSEGVYETRRKRYLDRIQKNRRVLASSSFGYPWKTVCVIAT